MTPSSPDRRPDAAHRIALVAVGALVGVSFTAGLGTTAARLTDSDLNSATTGITTRPACMQTVGAYTSEMLDAAVLRWSFSGALPTDAIASAPEPTVATTGLLMCDPAQLSASVGTPGSLALVQGAVGSGLTAGVPMAPGAPSTLLFWTTAPGASGELASLTGASGDVVLSVSGSTVQLTYPTSDGPVTTPGLPLADGTAHLVAVTFIAGIDPLPGALHLTVDGAFAVDATTTWVHTLAPGSDLLTIGAREASTNAGALVDEVTLLDSAYDDAQLKALVDADRWWAPGALP